MRKRFGMLSLVFLFTMMISGCSTSDNTNTNTNSNHPQQHASVASDYDSENQSIDSSLQTDKKLLPATIVKNVDGDTVVIKLNGREEKVRMLCVDTPETHHPRLGVQPFGPEASAYTKKILPVGKKVQIETGIGDGRDKYGRLLAYIYVDGKMFNEMLLEKGLARVAYIYAPNTKYVDQFYAIQKKAQKKGIGIWSIENYAEEDGYHEEVVKGSLGQPSTKSTDSKSTSSGSNYYKNNPSDDKETNLNCKGKIKGNANSHIYHVPDGAYYDTVKDNIVWFCSEQDAEQAGYRKSKR
ncbi:thermonuclease [Bacillus salipaludis]|uniref:Thermonuclease n=1 Tax=Bacillus salipaludis TaxID=2547811 RepID=A0A4R5VLE1_9BACI|nr:thermonuclease family protein [Bacillus salipaludis]MDQ6599214.1 thermonuclease family protein [Bacillus salipaludis]TDK58858.1 thermonuclease [Bacillus salipaludis]